MAFAHRMHVPGEKGKCAICLHHMQDLKSRAAAIGRHLAATIRGPVLWLTLCGGLLVAAIFVGTIMMVGEFRERALVNSERELENTVLLLDPSLRPAIRGLRHHRRRRDLAAADFRHRLREDFRKRMSSPEAHEILRSKAGVLSYLGDISIFDVKRRHDQLVAAVAGAGPQHLRAGLFQDLQIRSAIAIDADRVGPQLFHRQPELHHCPPAERAKTASSSA